MAGSVGYIKFSYETTAAPGNESVTPSASAKSLYPPFAEFSFDMNPTDFTRDDEVRGINEALAILPDKYDPTLTLVVSCYPDTAAFFLKAVTDGITTTAGDGVITDPDGATIVASAYRHVFVAPGGQTATAAIPITMNVKACFGTQDGEVLAYEGRGCAVTSIAFAQADARVQMTISMTPTYWDRISDPSLTPAFESLPNVHPFRDKDITIPTWLSSTGKNESGGFDFTVEKPVQTHRTMSIASLWPDFIDKGDGMITVTGTVDKRYLGSADWDAFKNKTGFAAKAKFANDSIVTGSRHYGMWLEMANAQYTSADVASLTNTRNIGAKYAWQATNLSGSAGSWTITLINGTSSYA